jgi:hypothetical protein
MAPFLPCRGDAASAPQLPYQVHAALKGDTWFPEWNLAEWRETFREDHAAGPEDDYPFSFVRLERTWRDRACIARLRARGL